MLIPCDDRDVNSWSHHLCRYRIFYAAGAPRHPGLPVKHILNNLPDDTREAAGLLAKRIFLPGKESSVLSSGIHVPKRLRGMLTVLGKAHMMPA